MRISRNHCFYGRLSLVLLSWLLVMPLWAGPGPGEVAPQWAMRDSSGETLRFPQDIEADVSLVLFWASWCPYCKALMPRLSALQQEFGVDRLPVLALRLEVQEEDSVPAWVSDGTRVFENAWDVAEDYGVSVLPGLFLVREGRIIYRLDYPPAEHSSQQIEHGKAQAASLGQWWDQRLRALLLEEGLSSDSG